MNKLLVLLVLASGAAFAQETERPVLVISTAAGDSSAGGEVGVYDGGARLTYGVAALFTGGTNLWAGALLDARWTILPGSTVSPYLGAGLGAFSIQRSGTDYGIQPTASFGAGISYWRLFAGARLLVPLTTRSSGPHPHDEAGFGPPALLGQLGLRI